MSPSSKMTQPTTTPLHTQTVCLATRAILAWPQGLYKPVLMMTGEEDDDLLAMDIDGLVQTAYNDRGE